MKYVSPISCKAFSKYGAIPYSPPSSATSRASKEVGVVKDIVVQDDAPLSFSALTLAK